MPYKMSYSDILRSDDWREFSKEHRAKIGHCELCGVPMKEHYSNGDGSYLECHHIAYTDDLFDTDHIIVICHRCHERITLYADKLQKHFNYVFSKADGRAYKLFIHNSIFHERIFYDELVKAMDYENGVWSEFMQMYSEYLADIILHSFHHPAATADPMDYSDIENVGNVFFEEVKRKMPALLAQMLERRTVIICGEAREYTLYGHLCTGYKSNVKNIILRKKAEKFDELMSEGKTPSEIAQILKYNPRQFNKYYAAWRKRQERGNEQFRVHQAQS